MHHTLTNDMSLIGLHWSSSNLLILLTTQTDCEFQNWRWCKPDRTEPSDSDSNEQYSTWGNLVCRESDLLWWTVLSQLRPVDSHNTNIWDNLHASIGPVPSAGNVHGLACDNWSIPPVTVRTRWRNGTLACGWDSPSSGVFTDKSVVVWYTKWCKTRDKIVLKMSQKLS